MQLCLYASMVTASSDMWAGSAAVSILAYIFTTP